MPKLKEIKFTGIRAIVVILSFLLVLPGIDALAYHLMKPVAFWQEFFFFLGAAFMFWPMLMLAIFVASVTAAVVTSL